MAGVEQEIVVVFFEFIGGGVLRVDFRLFFDKVGVV